jgi:precorrin-6A synthase
VAAYEVVLAERQGTAAFLVWGDPAFYDSTIRIVEAIAQRGAVEVEYDVVPGISALQLLAARHRIVLHDIGQPLHVTTARRLPAAIAAGDDNIVVMLGAEPVLDGLDDWSIWWGANLGATGEELVAGRVGDVVTEIASARRRARDAAGWVMDAYLLRRPS